MKHFRFTSNNRSVCEKPKLLGFDLVVFDLGDVDLACPDCLRLIEAYNIRTEQSDVSLALPSVHAKSSGEDLLFNPKALIGVVIGSVFWIVFFLVVWAVWLRG